MPNEFAFIFFLVSVGLFITSAILLRYSSDKLTKAAEALNILAENYIQAYEAVHKMIDNVSLRADNLHSRTNDLEHDMLQHNVLLPLVLQALDITVAKKMLEDSKIVPENFG